MIVLTGHGCYSLAERFVPPAFLNLGVDDEPSARDSAHSEAKLLSEIED